MSRKRILWVDPDITTTSPSNKHLVAAAPYLLKNGWSIEVWCWRHNGLPQGVLVRHISPSLPSIPLLQDLWFLTLVEFRFLWHRLFRKAPPADVIHAVGAGCFSATVLNIQFIHRIWLKKEKELGVHGLIDWVKYLLKKGSRIQEAIVWRFSNTKMLLPASDSIAADLQMYERPGLEIEVIPNSYDETRFNSESRKLYREITREKLGFERNEFIFVFNSQGHYKRKGFWLAVEALSLIRHEAVIPFKIRFLVVGGYPATLARLKDDLLNRFPDYEKWIVFTGMVKETENYFAAADAFLFPSYFEAFSLAEIEAAAMELPLLLTPHHGTEMILRDGVNGLVLPWTPHEIKQTLSEFLSGTSKLGAISPNTHRPNLFKPSTETALTRKGYADRLEKLYESCLERKT